MSAMRGLRTAKGVFFLLCSLLSFREVFSASFDSEFDEKPWQEVEAQLPSFPEREHLIQFKVGSVSDKQFFIDEKSISIGADEVIRYSLVVISSTGAQGVSFEGMRCATGERRFYAFGQADKTWSRARGNQWMKISGSGNQYPVALYVDYFCAIGAATVMKPADAVRVLRYGHKPGE